MFFRRSIYRSFLLLAIVNYSCKGQSPAINEKEAISIAKQELTLQIGADEAKHFEPYDVVSFSDTLWRVSGAALRNNELGAPPIVDIRKSDGKVVKVMLYK